MIASDKIIAGYRATFYDSKSKLQNDYNRMEHFRKAQFHSDTSTFAPEKVFRVFAVPIAQTRNPMCLAFGAAPWLR
jgi:hypothetical protein